ncbi:MAG: hypothetical protein ACKO37_10155 [Vampirovibrionales bacterium]
MVAVPRVQLTPRVALSPTKVRPSETTQVGTRVSPRLNPGVLKPADAKTQLPVQPPQTPEALLASLKVRHEALTKKKQVQNAQPKGIFDRGAEWLQEGAWALNKGLKAIKLPEIKFATVHAGNGSNTAQREALEASKQEIATLEKAIESAKKNKKLLNTEAFKKLTQAALNATDKAQTRVDVALTGRQA